MSRGVCDIDFCRVLQDLCKLTLLHLREFQFGSTAALERTLASLTSLRFHSGDSTHTNTHRRQEKSVGYGKFKNLIVTETVSKSTFHVLRIDQQSSVKLS